MSMKSNLNKNNWNDSMHIFFSPKLSLEGRKMFPQLVVDSVFYNREPNFLTVFKKPIVTVGDKPLQNCTKKQDKNKYVQVIGQNKNVEKRIQTTTTTKKRCISPAVDEELLRNYQENITQAVNLHRSNPKKRMSQNKISHLVYERPQKRQGQELYYVVGSGNNSALIQEILGKRMNWTQTNSSLFHFKWQQTRSKYHNNSITKQLHNHLPNHQIISDKVGLVNCLKLYCQKVSEQMFQVIPACFEFNFGDLQRCQNQIKKFIEFYWQISQKSVLKCQQQFFSSSQKQKQRQRQKQKAIKTESPKKISKKQTIRQNKNFRSYKKQATSIYNQDNIRKKEEIKQLHKTLLSKLKTYYTFVDMANLKKESVYITPKYSEIYGKTSLWLLKPSDLNRGRGIHLFRTIQELGDLLKSQLTRHQKGSFVIQKYIQKPMLIDNRKFDIRVYGLITQNRQYYFFSEGYIRTSSQKFDINSTNYYTHLTNNAIQKYSKTYGQFEQGNILPLDYLFKQRGIDRNQFLNEIKRKIKITFKASQSKIFNYNQKNMSSPVIHQSSPSSPHPHHNMNRSKVRHFQIFGFDFMLDQNLHIWLIQVNTNPCIELSNGWLKKIIPRMLDDAFKLTIDRMFPKGKQLKKPQPGCQSQPTTTINIKQPSDSKCSSQENTSPSPRRQLKTKKKNRQFKQFYSVQGYSDTENMWEQLDMSENIDTICTQRGFTMSQQL